MYTIPNFKPYFPGREKQYVDEALGNRLRESYFLGLFEENFARYIGRRHAIAVSSGTAGLHLLMKYVSDRKRGSVVSTPLTFVASANVILYERQAVLFSDISDDLLLDEDRLECLLEKHDDIIAVVYVDIFGNIPRSRRISDICARHNVFLIEDASQALGSRNKMLSAGQLGNGAVFSFNKNKQITSGGEGGMIVTDDESIFKFCVSMRDQGRVSGENWIDNSNTGYNYRMTELQAAIGCAQLERIDEFLKKRRELVSVYENNLRGLKNIVVASGTRDVQKSWFVFYILVGDAQKRRDIIDNLEKSEIECKTNYFPPVYRFKAYSGLGFSSPVAERFYEQVVVLPLYVEMTSNDVKRVTDIIKTYCV